MSNNSNNFLPSCRLLICGEDAHVPESGPSDRQTDREHAWVQKFTKEYVIGAES